MIKFFRNIRQRLLRENRFTRYLIYALGEIILVVIGILIALQINNWNENRKHQRSVKQYSEALLVDLKQDSIEFQTTIANSKKSLERNYALKKRLASAEVNEDTLKSILKTDVNLGYFATRKLNRNTLTTILSSGGLEYFNKKLSNQIQNYYQEGANEEERLENTERLNGDMTIKYLEKVYVTDIPYLNESDFSIFSKGKFLDERWDNLNFEEIYPLLSGLTTTQIVYDKYRIQSSLSMLKLNSELASAIRTSLK